jgi:hypothetical protein
VKKPIRIDLPEIPAPQTIMFNDLVIFISSGVAVVSSMSGMADGDILSS